MDNKLENPIDQEVQLETTQRRFFNFQNNTRTSIFAGVILLLLLLVGGAVFTSLPKDTSQDKEKQKDVYKAEGTVVYGFWKGQNAVIAAVDLESGKNGYLSVLPTNIKHVKILSSNAFSYLDQTDDFDYGTRLTNHTIDPSSDETIFETDPGFGIDDYVVSPDGRYAAVWLVEKPSGDNLVVGSRSRVYSVKISSKEKNLLYDEVSSSQNPVHYPVGITNSGEVFLDTFLPNSGAGWAYGMSRVDFNGGNKKQIDSMKNGTYSTQPVLSSDGKYFAFAGYDKTDGKELVNTYRKALVNPNTVELLSTSSLERTKIDIDGGKSLYPYVDWDRFSGLLLITSTQNEDNQINIIQYTYSNAGGVNKVMNQNTDNTLISVLNNNQSLFAEKFTGDLGTGNLGSYYSNGMSKLTIIEKNSSDVHPISFEQSPVQIIGITRSGFFEILNSGKDVIGQSNKQNLQLQTFTLKPTLVPIREERQSNPPPPPQVPGVPADDLPQCKTITYPQCNALLGTNYPLDKDLGDLSDTAFSDCVWAQQAAAELRSACLDSPLYLYGPAGTEVDVRIGTAISNQNVEIVDNKFRAETLNNGKIAVKNTHVDSIDFDYLSKVREVTRPDKGFIVQGSELLVQVKNTAKKLGLNGKETDDLLNFAQKIDSPYVYFSFFNHDYSHSILPLYFSPQPDSYRNIAFYFEKLNNILEYTPVQPVIEPVLRDGITAIEISYIIH